MAQENKFTRSVMERLEQEQQKHKQREQEKKTEATEAPVQALAEKPTEPKASKQTTAKASTEKKAAPKKTTIKKQATPSTSSPKPQPVGEGAIDLSQLLTPETKRSAKNKTFYLDTQVIDAVATAAKEQDMTESRLVNQILKGVFGL